jgi:predicted ATPase
MKIRNLWIESFKNLRDFKIDLDPGSLTTVLLGENGTGKSNLLEALVIIFRDLDLGVPPAFGYKLEYECNGHNVAVEADPKSTGSQNKYVVDGNILTQTAFRGAGDRPFLPKNVFGYYSGPSNRFENHFVKHQEKFYRQLLEGDSGEALRPLFYARLIHSQFVLLAFFYDQEVRAKEFLREYLSIEELESVLFVLKAPPWSSKAGDIRFWNARGAVRDFLDKVFALALAPMRMVHTVDLGLRKKQRQEHLYLYLQNSEALTRLRVNYQTPREFFKALESTYLSALLVEVRIRVRMKSIDGVLTFRELSEGEQQLLTVLGLLKFTKDSDALFLLDEPDTHLNPVWSLRYLELLGKVVGEERSSQIVMATHDPLTIAGLGRDQVRVMNRDANGKISSLIPEKDPKGMGISGILTSDIFGLRSDLDLATLHLLDRKRQLAIKDTLTEAEKEELTKLNDELSNLDFTNQVRDPMFKEFVDALARTEEVEKTPKIKLSREERERRRQLAQEVIKKLRPKESSKK